MQTSKPIFAVLYGSPLDGFKAHGPFATEAEANAWGEAMGEGGEWPMPIHPITPESCRALYPWSQPGADDVRACLAMPVTDLASAKAWIEALYDADLSFHFDDDPAGISDIRTDLPTFTPAEWPIVRERVAALFAQDWGPFECPHGYAIHVGRVRDPGDGAQALLDELRDAMNLPPAERDKVRAQVDAFLADVARMRAQARGTV